MKKKSENQRIKLRTLARWGGIISWAIFLASCSRTYPADRVKESIQEICRKEYSIENVQVKIAGTTVGVYLPMKKLFATDFKEALQGGNAELKDIENLFRPLPEALDQVEDVLFSTSRVLLSTDRDLKFYVLQATDIEKTGLQLVLTGYADDMKRVRLWDISRDEFRQRILHEIRMNRAVVANRPVRSFFEALGKASSLEEIQPYFAEPISPELFESLFLLDPSLRGAPSIRWHLGELRSIPLEGTQLLVYVPVTVEYDETQGLRPKEIYVPSGSLLEYFFVVSVDSEPARIQRVLPLFSLDEGGKIQKIQIPGAYDIKKDMESWDTEFTVSEIRLGDFLAEQLTRRTQALLFEDERIHNTFKGPIRLVFQYHGETPKSYFSLELDAQLKTAAPDSLAVSALHEDMLYLLSRASREFVEVLRSYRFSDYEFLQLNLAPDPASLVLPREGLELFRRNKADLQGILKTLSPSL